MKYEITSYNTKRMLAESLKKLLCRRPLSKVTVSEIVADCKVNRKTFYYHFEDLYSLLKWMLEQEAIEVVRNMDLIIDYEEAILFVLDYVEENYKMLSNICGSVGRDELKRFFYADFIGICRTLIYRIEEFEHLSVNEEFKEFLSKFYTEGITGILLDFIQHREELDRQKVVDYISLLIHTSIKSVLQTAAESRSPDL